MKRSLTKISKEKKKDEDAYEDNQDDEDESGESDEQDKKSTYKVFTIFLSRCNVLTLARLKHQRLFRTLNQKAQKKKSTNSQIVTIFL